MNLERAYLTFSRQNFRFSSAKISDDFFFSHRPQILNFPPIFPLLLVSTQNFLFPPFFFPFSSLPPPPRLAKILISPLFSENSTAFYILSVYFSPPYFGHDAFMHHPMHVLDAPA